ncbi:hypothetical protein FQR65_LT16656 [Abscondita terminalis]|nr:hypothetical protein FQR65_LT16656 [Abscondita terminalis]
MLLFNKTASAILIKGANAAELEEDFDLALDVVAELHDSDTNYFQNVSSSYAIEEVVVVSRIITKSGDTISYNINSFANQRDRVLADVLQKMPGIKVNPDGSVLYNGELVNKFYVNGKDLMSGSYKTSNNGESVEKQDNILAFGDSYEGMVVDASPNNLLSIENAVQPELSEDKYLMNNVHFISGNLLRTFKKDWE